MIMNMAYDSNNQQIVKQQADYTVKANDAKRTNPFNRVATKFIIFAVICGAIPQVLNFIARCFFHVDMMLPSAGIGNAIFTTVYCISMGLCMLAILFAVIAWVAKIEYAAGRKAIKAARKYLKIKF